MTEEKPVLKVEKVTKRYGSKEVVKEASLTVNLGEIKVLIGPSGGGEEHPASVH